MVDEEIKKAQTMPSSSVYYVATFSAGEGFRYFMLMSVFSMHQETDT